MFLTSRFAPDWRVFEVRSRIKENASTAVEHTLHTFNTLQSPHWQQQKSTNSSITEISQQYHASGTNNILTSKFSPCLFVCISMWMWNWLDETDVVHLVSQNVCILFHQMNMLSPDFGRTPTNGSVHGWLESGAGPIGGKDEDLKDYSPLIRLVWITSLKIRT